MKKINKSKLENGESYLCYTGYSWSPSGYDIGEYHSHDNTLISQSNGQDIMGITETIYVLPD